MGIWWCYPLKYVIFLLTLPKFYAVHYKYLIWVIKHVTVWWRKHIIGLIWGKTFKPGPEVAQAAKETILSLHRWPFCHCYKAAFGPFKITCFCFYVVHGTTIFFIRKEKQNKWTMSPEGANSWFNTKPRWLRSNPSIDTVSQLTHVVSRHCPRHQHKRPFFPPTQRCICLNAGFFKIFST